MTRTAQNLGCELTRRALPKDWRTPGPLQFRSEPFADSQFFVMAVLLAIFRLFKLGVFLLVDRLFTDQVDDQCQF